MRRITLCAVALALICPSMSVHAQKERERAKGLLQCDSETLRGRMTAATQPEDGIQCKLLGRIFCLVEEARDQKVTKAAAINDVSFTMGRIGETGSHVPVDFRPEVTMAADYVYSHDKMLPWTRYYYAAYSCGFNQRVADPSTQRRLSAQWEKAANECQRAHPGEGNGYPNDPLRDCLQQSIEALAASAGRK